MFSEVEYMLIERRHREHLGIVSITIIDARSSRPTWVVRNGQGCEAAKIDVVNKITRSRQIPGVERFVEIIVKGRDLLVMKIDSEIDFITQNERWRALGNRRLGFFAIRFTTTASTTERNIKINMQLSPVLERKCARDDFRIVSTILGVPVDLFHKGIVYDAKVIVDGEGLDRLTTDAFPV